MTATSWLDVQAVADGLWSVNEGGFVQWYVVAQPDGRSAVAIDCGWGIQTVRPHVELILGCTIETLALTHIHPDHHGAHDEFPNLSMGEVEWQEHGRKWNAGLHFIAEGKWRPYAIFEDMPTQRSYPAEYDRTVYDQRVAAGLRVPDQMWTNGQVVSIAGRTCHVVLTPGHTQGHVCLYFPDENWLFAGDAIVEQQWWWHLNCRSTLVAGLAGLSEVSVVLDAMLQRTSNSRPALVWPAHGQRPLAGAMVAEWVASAIALMQSPAPGASCKTPVGRARRHRLADGVEWLVQEKDWLAWCDDVNSATSKAAGSHE